MGGVCLQGQARLAGSEFSMMQPAKTLSRPELQGMLQVRQRFHVWQRNYDVYLGKQQVAAINSPLLAWEFAVKDAQGGMPDLVPWLVEMACPLKPLFNLHR